MSDPSIKNEELIDILITPTIERDYRRRKVFDDMWSDHADKVWSSGFVHIDVCVYYAREILEDAKDQCARSDAPRGTNIAYTALVKQIKRRLRALLESVTTPIPALKPTVIAEPWGDNPARFKVGEVAMIWAPGDPRHGTIVEIVLDLALELVPDDDGPHHTAKGERVALNYVYGAKAPGDDALLSGEPHYLRNIDGSVRHLQLVRG